MKRPAPNHKRSRRVGRNNTGRTGAGLWQSFTTNRSGLAITTNGVAVSNQFYTMSNLISADINPASQRTAQLRRVRVRFNPVGVNTFSAQQPFEIQLFYVSIDGQNIALTKTVPLSLTNSVNLSFSLPPQFTEQRAAGDTNPVLGIQFVNRAMAAAVATTIYFTIQSSFTLSADFNETV
jgi:hypothetical protein